MLLLAAAAPAGAGPTGWAHQATGFQSNGAVTVKSLAGGSYAGTQNPSGAVAKTNQNAATQAPTVIIQATAGGNIEVIPMLVAGSVLPTCPTGYNSIFSASGTGPVTNPYVNAGGSRLTLANYGDSGGWTHTGWFFDSQLYGSNSSSYPAQLPQMYTYVSSANQPWAARVCSK